jgi:hypothetical protein
MAVVKGVKEQVHLPLYDCVEVKPNKQLGGILTSNVLRFFVDVTGKTKLLTNMQAASLLPHWNTFEARALRVVISDLCPQFPTFDAETATTTISNVVVRDPLDSNGDPIDTPTPYLVNLGNVKLTHLVDLSRRFEHSTGNIEIGVDEVLGLTMTIAPVVSGATAVVDGIIVISQAKIKAAASQLRQNGATLVPPLAQLFPNNGCGNVIGNFIYNTVTTFFVGEKIMIQVPTWFFPAGAGPYSEDGGTITHGYPNPQATFRFAEPVVIETQQNFRVEIEIPESDVLKDLQSLYGPLFIWVVLDGYMTRDVQ